MSFLESKEGFIMTEHNCAIASVASLFPGICEHESLLRDARL